MLCPRNSVSPTNNYTTMFIAIEHNMDMSSHYRLNLIEIETTVLFLYISTFTLWNSCCVLNRLWEQILYAFYVKSQNIRQQTIFLDCNMRRCSLIFLGMKDTLTLWNFGNYPTQCNIPQDLSLYVFHVQNTNNADKNTSTSEINHFYEIPKFCICFLISHITELI